MVRDRFLRASYFSEGDARESLSEARRVLDFVGRLAPKPSEGE